MHGIGTQRRGDTLAAFGNPIFMWARERSRRGIRDIQVELGSSDAEPSPDFGIPPAHTLLTIRWQQDAKFAESTDGTLLLAEAYWGSSFASPGFLGLVRWSFQALPAAAADALLRLSRHGGGLLKAFAYVVVAVLVFGFLVPTTQFMLLAAAVLALLPVRVLKDAAASLQETLAGTLGDSYIVVSDPIRRQSVTHTIKDSLEWLAALSKRVVVIAHSQGAPLATDAVKAFREEAPDDETHSTARVLTFGSGTRKLVALDEVANATIGDRFQRNVRLFQVIQVIQFFSIALLLLAIWTFDSPALWSYLFVALVFTTQGVGAAGASVTRSLAKLWEERDVPDWVDEIWATRDPVPSGTLLTPDDDDRLLSMQVTNRNSVLRDHTTYWLNRDQFVPLVGDYLARALKLDQSNAAVQVLSIENHVPSILRVVRKREVRTRWYAWSVRGFLTISTLASIISAVGLMSDRSVRDVWRSRGADLVGQSQLFVLALAIAVMGYITLRLVLFRAEQWSLLMLAMDADEAAWEAAARLRTGPEVWMAGIAIFGSLVQVAVIGGYAVSAFVAALVFLVVLGLIERVSWRRELRLFPG